MPPRSNPTARQERLGAELRKMRERAGMTAREAAGRLGVSPMQMSHMEVGRIGVSAERLRTLADHYCCADRALVDALAAMATERVRGWWEDYRGTLAPMSLDLAAMEWHSRRMRALQVVHIPGLLQVEPYMRALFTYARLNHASDHLEAVIDFRLRRRNVLERDDPPEFTAIIHEAALLMRVGDRKAAREQLEHILETSELPGVTVCVVPFSAEGFAGMGYAMTYAAGPVPQLDTAQIDHFHGIDFLHTEAQLEHYRALLRTVESSAMSAEDSRAFIHRIAREL
ncbi:helix-turn-helix domain-containing protein [Streptomyces rhizosphaericus]|uniref:Transcriptional regulator WhiJ n=1 Tax=Streptomyces rhizosphaericus TaxID=114699 RepID=A0ABP4APK8_9ACTN|nr:MULTISPECIES: helix-turn-helix transcriptional regulator [Streptomyces violaceusniger group]